MTVVNIGLDVTKGKGKRYYWIYDSDYSYNTVLQCKINIIL